MEVIDLCDSDDDETDTRELQNKRLDTSRSFQSTPAKTTSSRAVAPAVTRRPRSISSLSNGSDQTNDDAIAKPMTAREKSWAMFQQMRQDSRREASKEKTELSTPAASTSAAPNKKPPPPKVHPPPQEKRKRKRSNSSSDHRKKSADSSTMAKKSAATKTKRNDNMAPRKKQIFLEQGLINDGNNNSHPTDQQNSPPPPPPQGQVATNSLDLLSSLASFPAVEVYDEIFPNHEENNQHETVEETAEPSASTGATLQAAIEIDSDGDNDEDDDDDIIEVLQNENGKTQEDACEQDVGQNQQQQLQRQVAASLEARPTENFHPLLQLDSTQPAEQQDQDRDQQDFPSARDNTPLDEESEESVVRILDHRFHGEKVIFEVQDRYGTVHRGIQWADLKVDAPALLSKYVLGKRRGKLCDKKFRKWALKTMKKLGRKNKKHRGATRQKRKAHENVGLPEARAVSNPPAQSTAQSSHIPIGIDDAEGELKLDFGSSSASGRKSPNPPPVPGSETRDSAVPPDTQIDILNDNIKENDDGNEASISDVDIATTMKSETQGDCAPAQLSSQSLAPKPDENKQGEANCEIIKDSHPLEGTSDTRNESEDLASIDNGKVGPQKTGQTDSNENRKVPLQVDVASSAVPDLNEEVPEEQTADTSNETEPPTAERTPVGLRPTYTIADVAMEMEEDDDDDEIEVIDVKAPIRKEPQSPPPLQNKKRTLAEQMIEEVDDNSDDSVQSASPPPSRATGQPLVGSIETPIAIDDNDDNTMATDEMYRSFPTMEGKKKASAPPTCYSYPERRFVFHGTQPKRPPLSARRPTASTWSYGWSCDAAMKEQERLFQASAAKMRSQTIARVATNVVRNPRIKFQQVEPDIAKKYPLHWQFSDYSARLGVPEGSSEIVIKKQYRRLALLYHPDKSQLPNTSTKFQNITEAYRALLNR